MVIGLGTRSSKSAEHGPDDGQNYLLPGIAPEGY